MADVRKEQQRDELHRAIWAIADELRGSVDGWDFKSYVLGIMFYRYISENLTNYINEGEIESGNDGFDYSLLLDEDAEQAREDLVQTKGFFILPSELFCNVRKKAANDENLNMTLEAAFNHIEESAKGSESEDNFAGLFDDIDVNSNKLGATVAKRNANLVKLIEGVANMGLGNYKDNSIDAFGDAYEYLMSMYAFNAGKSGGEFFTPQEVSELLTRMAVAGKREVNKVYDPACGSGSLLLKAAKILGKENVRQGFYGQEINLTTYNLCRINMFLHDIDFDKFDIAHEDTLVSPQHWDDEPFEVIVSNPPYSIKWEGDDNPVLINDPRFSPAGVLAPKSKADLAFIMHSLAWLATNGTAAIVCFPGIMYRGGAEKKIHCEDKEILVAIDKAIKSSLQLRSKRELIENFIATVNTSTDVNADWQRFVKEQRETDIQTLIAEERLKPEETRRFVENAFRDGVLKTTGTDVDRLMPPVSRFGGGGSGSRDKKKQTVIEKLKGFFEKYFGLVSPEVLKAPDKVTYLYDTEPTQSMVAEEPVHYGIKKGN